MANRNLSVKQKTELPLLESRKNPRESSLIVPRKGDSNVIDVGKSFPFIKLCLAGRTVGGKEKDKVTEVVTTEGLSPELASLQKSVLKACKENYIKFPITRHDFVLICKSMNLHCTTRQAIEAVLVSRGKSLE